MKKIVLLSCMLLSISSFAQDSLITARSGVAHIAATSDTTTDTTKLVRFIEVQDIVLYNSGIANLITIDLVTTDIMTYSIIDFALRDYTGKSLYSDRIRLSGSCFTYGFGLLPSGTAANYLFWKICHAKGFTPK